MAALLTVLLVIAVVVGLVTLVGTQIASGFPDLENQASNGLAEVQHWLATGPLHITTDQLADYVGRLQSSLSSHTGTLVSGAFAAAGTVSDVLAGIFIALFSTYFMLAQGDVIWGWVLKVLPDAAQEPMDVAGRRGWVTLTSYIRATVLVAATDALGHRHRRGHPGRAARRAAGRAGLPRRVHPGGRCAGVRHRRRAGRAGVARRVTALIMLGVVMACSRWKPMCCNRS